MPVWTFWLCLLGIWRLCSPSRQNSIRAAHPNETRSPCSLWPDLTLSASGGHTLMCEHHSLCPDRADEAFCMDEAAKAHLSGFYWVRLSVLPPVSLHDLSVWTFTELHVYSDDRFGYECTSLAASFGDERPPRYFHAFNVLIKYVISFREASPDQNNNKHIAWWNSEVARDHGSRCAHS